MIKIIYYMSRPVVFVIGTTAVGKTKAVLSMHGGVEVVGCDAMQMYQGADIMTAKSTPQ